MNKPAIVLTSRSVWLYVMKKQKKEKKYKKIKFPYLIAFPLFNTQTNLYHLILFLQVSFVILFLIVSFLFQVLLNSF